eukprot:3746073-Amphidinium_carterae.1
MSHVSTLPNASRLGARLSRQERENVGIDTSFCGCQWLDSASHEPALGGGDGAAHHRGTLAQ